MVDAETDYSLAAFKALRNQKARNSKKKKTKERAIGKK